jgi:hypothetical protein
MSPAAINFASLCDELGLLIDAPPARDDAARAHLERTLTDGYAYALVLESERLRLERRRGELLDAGRINDLTQELGSLTARIAEADERLEELRELLDTLRRRASRLRAA